MKLTKKYVTNNMHYKNNRIINVSSLVLHSVGTPQPSPDVFYKVWNTDTNQYLAQIVVGTDTAYEVLPCTSTKGKAVFCWHVGTHNSKSIGVELTEPSTIKYTKGAQFDDLDPENTEAHVLKTYENAVDIFAQLCKIHNLDPTLDGVILSHKECHARGIGTNHGDPEHLWSRFGLSLDQFRIDVSDKLGKSPMIKPDSILGHSIKVGDLVKISSGATYYNGKFIPNWVKSQNWYVSHISGDKVIIDKNEKGTNSINSPINAKYLTLSKEKFKSFVVSVSIENLNMRTGPSTKDARIGYIPKGSYTIVETSGDWGRLKSKQTYRGKSVDAWISLKYTKKL